MPLKQNNDRRCGFDLEELSPSPLVRRFAEKIVQSAGQYPVLDVACGGGRNGAVLAHLGARVVGIDVDLTKIDALRKSHRNSTAAQALQKISLTQLDLIRDPWPYERQSIGAIINVHFLHLPLLKSFASSLIPGGILVMETVQNRGGNYVALPREGQVRVFLKEAMDFLVYQEVHAGPPASDAVTVRLVGEKHTKPGPPF